jgi:hypothetical protein
MKTNSTEDANNGPIEDIHGGEESVVELSTSEELVSVLHTAHTVENQPKIISPDEDKKGQETTGIQHEGLAKHCSQSSPCPKKSFSLDLDFCFDISKNQHKLPQEIEDLKRQLRLAQNENEDLREEARRFNDAHAEFEKRLDEAESRASDLLMDNRALKKLPLSQE